MAKKIRNFLIYLFIFTVFIHISLSLIKIINTSAPDFSVLYDSTLNLVNNRNLYHDSRLFTELGYPPFSLVFFLPLIILPYNLAQAIWILASFIALIGCIYLCFQLQKLKVHPLYLLLTTAVFFLYFPVKFTLGMGQLNLIALFLLMLSFYSNSQNKFILSGLSFGLSLLVKPQLVILTPFMFLVKLYMPLFFSFTIVFIALAISILYSGLNNYIVYVNQIVPVLSAFAGRDIYYNQGLSAFLSRILPVSQAVFINSLLSLTVILISFWVIWKRELKDLAFLALLLPAYLLIEPLSWQHHYVFLIPSFIWLWVKGDSRIKTLTLIAFLVVGYNIKRPELLRSSLFAPVLLSHGTIGTIIIYLSVLWINLKKHT